MADTLSEVSWGLKVTDRGLNEYEKLAGFDHKNFPPGTIILNIGSGAEQAFEQNLRKKRPDLKIISIDPSVIEKRYDYQGATYSNSVVFKSEEDQRILANKERTLVALGQKLPLKDECVNIAIDIHAVAHYAKSEEQYKKYLREVMRVLKPGGEFYIFNTYMGDPIIDNKGSERKSLEYARSIFEELGIEAKVSLVTERVLSNYKGKQNVPDKRVRAIIRKRA